MHMRFLWGTSRFGLDHCGGFIAGFWCIWEAESVGEVWGGFGERCDYFLSLMATFESSGLDLLVVRWRDWRQRCATQGRGFELGRGVIVN